jgi:prepilin-type N-terminal cleavage/methylation domain-containing protein
MIHTPHAPAVPRGFSLVELLTVVTIIVILAGLTIGGLSYFNRRQAEDKIRVQLKLLANACEEFKYDYGTYPPLPDKSGNEVFTNTGGTTETNRLWTALYGDTDNDGSTYTGDSDQSPYIAELDPDSTAQGWIAGYPPISALKLVDGFGNEYRYRKRSNKNEMRNPDFDLWSMGADGKTNDSPTSTAKETKDDLWN